MPTAAVIGAGIAGLSSALALRERGWQVTVHEQAASLTAAGSGLALAPNALRALDVINVGDRVRELAVHGEFAGGIRDRDGAWLARTDMRGVINAFGDPLVLLPRYQLITELAQRLDPQHLRLGTRIDAIDCDKGVLSTPDGDIHADLIVGADGIHSATRSAMFPAHPATVYSGQTTWRTVITGTDLPIPACEYWGPGALAAAMPLSGGDVYFYAAAMMAPNGHTDNPDAELSATFASWAAPIPAFIAASDPRSILRHDVHILAKPLTSFHRGKTVLTGDAAHPMTPNLGQGACQAIEDAVVLAHEMTRHGDGPPGYSRARVHRTNQIVRRSKAAASLAMTRRGPAITARNAAIRAASRIAPHAFLKQGRAIFGWSPPVTPSAE